MIRFRPSRRTIRYSSLALIAVLMVLVTRLTSIFWTVEHGYASPARIGNALLDKYAVPYCDAKGFKPYKENGKHGNYRKVYDLFVFSNELDWLEIRLHSLASYVDYFVIVESPKTLSGDDKPLHLVENWDRFKRFESQIIHQVVDTNGISSTDKKDYLRNALFEKVFPRLVGTEQAASDGDALLVGNIDEIPKSDTLLTLRNCDFPRRLTLRSYFYHYSFEWKDPGEQWHHPQATTYHGLGDTILPGDLRDGTGGHGWLPIWPFQRSREKAELQGSGWHCSFCFPSIKVLHEQMDDLLDPRLNTKDNRNAMSIAYRIKNGINLFGEEGQSYDHYDNKLFVPEYIRSHLDDYQYLLTRRTDGAGFNDWAEYRKPGW